MDETRIIAAILASGVAQHARAQGHNLPMAAAEAVDMYRLILAELQKANLLPPSES
jgi:hypothetical protein